MGTQPIKPKSSPWPAGPVAECACPHCGHVDTHQIENVRDWGLDARDGECSACLGEYLVVAKEGAVLAEKLPDDARSFLIRHYYDVGDQGVTIRAPQGFDARRAAVFMQFCAEEWFGAENSVTNLGIAAALVSFYGCKHSAKNPRGEVIDMHIDRTAACPSAAGLMADESLQRKGLRDFLAAHLDG